MDRHEKTINFFDSHAEKWDGYQKEFDYKRLSEIIDRANLNNGARILDVACGTGILTEVLISKDFKNITAIDISPKMIEIFRRKFPSIQSVIASFEDYDFQDQDFDCVFIFNAFPHFCDPSVVFEKSSSILREGGKLIIAHSMTREELNQHHKKAGKEVEKDILISDREFSNLYRENDYADIVIDNNHYFFSKGSRHCCKI